MSNLKIKNIFYSIAKWLLFLFVAYVLQLACITGDIRPFQFAILFVLVWCNQNILLACLIHILSTLLFDLSLDSLVISSFACIVLLLLYFIHYKIKKPLNIPLLVLYAFLSQIIVFIKAPKELSILSNLVFELIIGLIFLICCLYFFQSLILRKKGQRLPPEQMVCGGVVLLVFGLGLSNIEIFDINLLNIFVCFLIFLFANDNKNYFSLVIATTIGLGVCLKNLDITQIVLFSSYALFATIFMHYNKYVSLFSVLAIDAFLCLFIKVDAWNYFHIIEIIFGFILYYLSYKKLSPKINQYFIISDDKLSFKNIVNRNRELLSRQLFNVSEVFDEMNKVFRSLAVGAVSKNEAQKMLSNEISNAICKDCPNRAHCLRLNSKELMQNFSLLVSIALEKGKVSIIDIPSSLSQKCSKVNVVINTVNNIVNQYREYQKLQSNMDASKLLIGEQFGGVSKIMYNMANQLNGKIEFDEKKEKTILEELNYNNIDCLEVVVFNREQAMSECVLVIKKEDILANKINKIISKIFKCQMEIVSFEESKTKGYYNVYIKPMAKYDLIFGTCQHKKAGTNISGDTHSIIRLSDNKIMFAISDGMGSGTKANNASKTAISLIENFYKAGFDNDTILSSVNKMLSVSSNEIFSALDICVVDLNIGVVDVIKIGATIGFIKHKFQTDILQTGSLPMGILDDVKPNIARHALSHGDNIILMSDGIIDSFSNPEQAQTYINNLQTLNPQTLAEQILSQALDNDKQSPNDDMTVFVARILQKI